MKKKLLSLVLAAMMTIGCFAGLGAAVGQDADFAALSVEDQYAAIMAAGSEADAQALFDTLDAEQQAALSAYAEAQAEASEPETYAVPAVNYTNVAPFVQQASPARARMLAKAASTSNVKTADGLVLNKTATPVEGSADDYKITLEAYTTGTVSTSETTKPTDIVLVLDQSGSMAWNMTSSTYTEKYPGNDHNGTYYVKNGSLYVAVTWCSHCGAWTDGCTDYWIFGHDKGKSYTPKSSSSDSTANAVQFYERTGSKQVIRLDALKDAVTAFANSVKDKSAGPDNVLGTNDDVDHRIAVVGFSSDNYNNTELLTGVTIKQGDSHRKLNQTTNGTPFYYPTGYEQNGVQYGSITTTQYRNALQSMSKTDGQTSVSNAINALTAHGGTYTFDGLDMAAQILKNSDGTDRNRVVVLFTDGDTDSTRSSVVNKAYELKNTYNATVYTVGIFDGANGQPPIDTNNAPNALMHRISSNYPDAQYVGGRYSGNYVDGNLNTNLKSGESYYLSASDADTLSTIFQKISNQISESKIDLGSDTQIKDVVSKYFDMPKNTSAVSVKSYDCTGFSDGKPTWSETGTVLNNAVTLDTENNTVNVTGFDFNANYVTVNGRSETDPKQPGNFHGRKLVIEFTVSVKDGFVGGNNVPTNGTDSGVYDKDGKLVANFVVPEVNVSITSSVGTNDKVIYEGNSVNVKDLYDEVDTSGADSWKYDFVKISYAVKQGDAAVGNTVAPADCTDYTVTATFAPISDGEGAQGVANDMAGKSVDGTAKVHVLKPTLTAKAEDVTRYYGESYTPDGSNVNASVSWTDAKHSNITAADATGDAPYTTKDIQIGYDWVGKIGTDIVPNHDTDVNLTYKVNGNDITDKVNGDKSYKVIAKTCTLTVNKSVAKTYSNNDSFIFNVVGKGNVPYNAQVVITGNGSATLTGLPVGDYTVTEDTAWSWRYKSDNSKATTTLSSAKDNDSVTITNKLDDNRWLGDETFVINKCEKSKITKIYESVMSFFGIV